MKVRLSLLSFASGCLASGVILTPSQQKPSDKFSYKNCGEATDAVQVKSIEIYPDTPTAGKNITIVMDGEVLQDIVHGAIADIVVKAGLIQILKRTFDLCELAENQQANVSCPVERGEQALVQTVMLPSVVPKALYTVNARGFTAEDDPMFCLDILVDFRT
ncbi:ML domain-containing protein [Cytidiella melzeri]|nr:ML domain-containing protein [Cytidiella melzeri]